MIEASSSIDIAVELIERYRKDCVRQGMAPSSVKSYVSSILIFNQYLKNRGLEPLQVDKDVLRDFLDHLLEKNLVQKTIKGYFTKISSFYDFLVYEDYMDSNPAPAVRKRYVRSYKDNDAGQMRKLISVKEMTMLINSTLDIRDKAVIALLAKTGIRRNELITLDIGDIDWVEQSIRLKPTAKRTNRTIFFDDETAFILKRWLRSRESRNKKKSKALFINSMGDRLNRHGVYDAVTIAAARVGIHSPESDRMEDHFSPHCCRHWFTTHLRRAGMPREFIQELRGDVRKEAIDIYDHIDRKELRESYLAHIPQMGI